MRRFLAVALGILVIAATPVVFDGEVLRVELDEDGLREVTVFRVHGAVKGIPFRAKTPEAACVGLGAHSWGFVRLVQWSGFWFVGQPSRLIRDR